MNHILIPTIENPSNKTDNPNEYVQTTNIEIIEDRDLQPFPQDPNRQDPSQNSRSWIIPIVKYLQNGMIPSEEKRDKVFKMRVLCFVMIQGRLCRTSMACPYLRCLEDHEALEVLKDIHEGYCGNHTGGKSLGSKVLRTGYYWAMMKINAFLYAKKCDACQRHRNILRRPAESLHPIIPPWPFMKWGMDIIGKLLKALGGNVFMLVMKNYFSKWIEAATFVQVRDKEGVSFIKRNILTRFGILSEIICDNGSH